MSPSGRVLGVILQLAFAPVYGAEVSGRAIDPSAVTLLGVQAGGAQTLSDVVALLGPAKVWRTGDASTSESKVCYRIHNEAGEHVVVFASNAEMASPKGQVNHIRVYSPKEKYSGRLNCGTYSAAEDLKVSNGLRIGSTPAQVGRLLWKPELKGNKATFDSCTKRYMKDTDPFFGNWVGKKECFDDPSKPYLDDCSTVEVRFKNGAASGFHLTRIQSVC